MKKGKFLGKCRGFISLLLAVCMIVTPLSAFAEDVSSESGAASSEAVQAEEMQQNAAADENDAELAGDDLTKWDGSTIDTDWYTTDTTKTEYTISTAAQLAGLASLVNGTDKVTFEGKTVKIGADLDMGSFEWTPIGNNTTSYGSTYKFKGTFDGQGHTISNIKISDVEILSNAVFNRGFFGYTESATIKDFTLIVDITYAKNNAGGVVATAKNTTFDGITVKGSIQVSSKASAANQVGGIVGNTDTSVTITNCKNEANINGNASAYDVDTGTNKKNYVKSTYVGGIVGKAVKATISDCENTGKIGGGYAVGGIVGQTYTNPSTIERCINNGAITANQLDTSYKTKSYAVGGIVGYLYKADTVDGCINNGKISANTTTAAGIVGTCYTKGASITNCYNTGAVENKYADGVVGGIVGYAGTGTYSQTDIYIKNCYNAGKLTGAEGKVGGILAAYAKSGATVSTDYISGNYYFSDTAAAGIGSVTSIPDGAATAFTNDASTGYTALIVGLGGSYKADVDPHVNNGLPILRWQDPNALFVASIKLDRDKDDNAGGNVSVTVKSEEGTVQTATEGTDADTYSYELKKGKYTYEVNVQGYTGASGSETTTGSFTIDKSSKDIEIPLTAIKYTWKFKITTPDADMTLKDANGKEIEATTVENQENDNEVTAKETIYTYELYNGTYKYSASKFGYEEGKTDTASVDGDVVVNFAGGEQTIQMAMTTALGRLKLDVSFADGKSDITPAIYITSEEGDYKGTVIYENDKVDGIYFPTGKYSYTVNASGYKKASGEFELTEDNKYENLVIKVNLEVSTAWDGTSVNTDWYTKDPSADTFYIYTADDLAGLAQIVNNETDTFKDKTVYLMSDIDLGSGTWNPIGTFEFSGNKYFAGNFDGNYNSITINQGRFATGRPGFGLFGCVRGKSVTERASVKNLTFYGKVKAESSSSQSYIGALAGYATYADFECIANSMDIDLTVQTSSYPFIDLGGLVGWSMYNNFSKCSNQGNISGAIDSTAARSVCYVGGICGMATQAYNAKGAYSIVDCYNNGNISSSGATSVDAGGIVGSTSSNPFGTIANCYNSGEVTSGQPLVGSGTYTSDDTKNNYYLDTTLGDGVTNSLTEEQCESKTDSELKALAPTLGDSYKPGKLYPVLAWQAAPVSAVVSKNPDKVDYNDFDSFEDKGLELTVYYSEADAEAKTNGTKIVSGWQILDGDCLAAGQKTVTVSYMGVECQVPVNVTQIVHYIYTDDLTFDIKAPAAGETPQKEIKLSDEQAKKIASASIKWYADGSEMSDTDTFADGVYYRAEITLDSVYEDGKVWYNFDSSVKPEIDGIYEMLYRTLENNATRFNFTLTWSVSDKLTDKASHSYYAGDKRVAADYAQYLDDTLTVNAGDSQKVYTVREIEKMALTDGIEKTYSYQGLNSRTNYTMTGLPIYSLLRDACPDILNATDESVITIGTKDGTKDFTLGELSSTGYSYDDEGEVIEKKLPYIISYGVNHTPYTEEKGPLYMAAPAPGKDNDNSANFIANVSEITINIVTSEKYNVTFSAVDSEGNVMESAVLKLTDKNGNTVYNGALGTVELNNGETYDYAITADGYGVKSGTVSGAATVKVELLKAWSGQYTEPEKDENGAYLIYNPDEFMWYNQQATTVSNARSMEMMKADIKLMADIDMAGTEGKWLPMGSLNGNNTLYFYVVNPDLPKYYGGGAYSGTFDGNGHVIRNLNVDWENYYVLEESFMGSPLAFIYRLDYLGGLFGMTKGATIKNVGIEGSLTVLDRPASTLADWYQFGGIVGFAGSATTITGCYTDIDLNYKVDTSTETLDGYAYAGYSDKCDLYIGGLVGSLEYSSTDTMSVIENSYSKGTLHSGGTRTVRAGGIVGATRNCKNKITKCWSAMSIAVSPSQTGETETFPTYAGGIIGGVNCVPLSSGNDETEISYCFALNPSITIDLPAEYAHANRVIGDEDFASNGGTAKYNFGLEKMAINGANFTVPDSEQNYRTAVGRTIIPERAYNAKTYTNVYWNSEGDIWKFDGSSYPILSWQKSEIDPAKDPSEDPDDSGSDDSGSDDTDKKDDGIKGSSEDKINNNIDTTDDNQQCNGKDNCPSAKYTDVDTSEWYHESLDYVIEQGLFEGISDQLFAPSSSMTRAMFATVLMRYEKAAGKEVDGYTNSFSDVASGSWYEKGVAWASGTGVVNGVGEGKFAPNANITREQLAVMMYRYADYLKLDTSAKASTLSFTDSADISDYAADALAWAYEKGIMTGKTGNRLDPKGYATRAEVAKVISSFAKVASEK